MYENHARLSQGTDSAAVSKQGRSEVYAPTKTVTTELIPGDAQRLARRASDHGVATAKLCILAIGALHPDSALSSDTPRFGMRLPGVLPEDSSQ